MTLSKSEYLKAREELEYLKDWLARLAGDTVVQRDGFTAASVQKMISRVQKQIADYEAANVPTPPGLENRAELGDAGAEPHSEGRN